MPKVLAPFRKGCPTKLLPRHVAIVVDVVPTGSWAESEDTLVAVWFTPKRKQTNPTKLSCRTLTTHFSAPPFDAKDVLHTGSRGCLQDPSDEGLGRESTPTGVGLSWSLAERMYSAPAVGSVYWHSTKFGQRCSTIERRGHVQFKRPRKELNLHVLRTGSRVCIKS